MSVSKVLCLAAVLFGAALVADATPRRLQQLAPSSDAADDGTPYDALWMCATYFSGTPKYGSPPGDCGSAQAPFMNLLTSIVPAKFLMKNSTQMMLTSSGCCIQIDILNTTQTSLASSPAFNFMVNKKTGLAATAVQNHIASWAKTNGICGPSTAIDFLVGWDIYQPVSIKYFGCNVGTAKKLPPGANAMTSLCHC